MWYNVPNIIDNHLLIADKKQQQENGTRGWTDTCEIYCITKILGKQIQSGKRTKSVCFHLKKWKKKKKRDIE